MWSIWCLGVLKKWNRYNSFWCCTSTFLWWRIAKYLAWFMRINYTKIYIWMANKAVKSYFYNKIWDTPISEVNTFFGSMCNKIIKYAMNLLAVPRNTILQCRIRQIQFYSNRLSLPDCLKQTLTCIFEYFQSYQYLMLVWW